MNTYTLIQAEAMLKEQDPHTVWGRRLANELAALSRLSSGMWGGLLEARVAFPEPKVCLLTCQLSVEGRTWDGDHLRPCLHWVLAVSLGPWFPGSAPHARFLSDIPFSPHVIHPLARYEIEDQGNLRPYVEEGAGAACWIDPDQYQTIMLSSSILGMLLFASSTLVSGNSWVPEFATLNPQARSHFQHCPEDLPFGPGFPYPLPDSATRAGDGLPSTGRQEAVEWDE